MFRLMEKAEFVMKSLSEAVGRMRALTRSVRQCEGKVPSRQPAGRRRYSFDNPRAGIDYGNHPSANSAWRQENFYGKKIHTGA